MNSSAEKNSNNLLFWVITIAFPFVLLLLVELSLRLFGFRADYQPVFRELTEEPGYMVTNPDYASRYFPAFTPKVAPSPFRKEKTAKQFRVVVLGGSSTQGFPYNFYNSFSARLEYLLMMHTQDLNIEVINLGMTAVNSYVIWDLKEAVSDLDPDAVIIYAGHNEYYGSFGVGSSMFGLGSSITLKRTILRLKNLRLYQAIEQQLAPEEDNNNRTLMARVVRESEIDYGSELFEQGLRQFEKNMTETLSHFRDADIPVYFGTLASNLKDQSPLGESETSEDYFEQAKADYGAGRMDAALKNYILSKDYDNIRFRAPSDLNDKIRVLAENFDAEVVDIHQLSIDSSASGIPDDSFFDDHLHPNALGNQMVGEAFYRSLSNHPGLRDRIQPNSLSARIPISRFEKTTAYIPIARLKAGYPFKKGISQQVELASFRNTMERISSRSFVDSVAAYSWSEDRKTALSLTDVINQATRERDSVSVMQHYLNLAQLQVFNEGILKRGVVYAINNRNLDIYTANLLEFILNKDRKDPFFSNSLSAIYLLNGDLNNAEYWLMEADETDPDNPNILYNIARLKVMQKDTAAAKIYFDKYRNAQR